MFTGWRMSALVLIVFIPISLSARENKLKAFCHLSRPEKCWVVLHPFVASKAWKATQLTRQLSIEISKDTILDGDLNGGQVDAFRHTYWLALLSQKMRWKKAWRLSEAHEKGNYLAFRKGKMEDGILPDSASSAMDRFNNQLGIDIGRANKFAEKDSLTRLVVQAILNGHAKVLAKNSHGDYLDCKGNIISVNSKKWNIPKCLIPSGIPRE